MESSPEGLLFSYLSGFCTKQIREQLPCIQNGDQVIFVIISGEEALLRQRNIRAGILCGNPAEQNCIRSGNGAVTVDIAQKRFR